MRTPWKHLPLISAILAIACGAPNTSQTPSTSQDAGVTVQAPQFIINGQLDDGQYPQVGTYVLIPPGGSGLVSRCSGTLLSERVFLTAAHCIHRISEWGLQHGEYGVSFDAVFVPGFSEVIFGTGYMHPQYDSDLTTYDVGIIVLDREVHGLKPKHLSRPNVLTKMKADRLAAETIVTVGYGLTGDNTGRGTRRVATQHFLSLCTFDWSSGECVQDGGHPYYNWVALGGPFESGNGTVWLGDSGGPHFLDGKIIAVTSLADGGESGMALEWAQRVDIEPVRQFIMSFLEDDEGDD
jgi:secreted trypsin-like serine protease